VKTIGEGGLAVGEKVVNFSLGAKFYFQRGNYYYQKNNLDKALIYYQRALAVDPADPVNHFNLACLLSEQGKYRESSVIFKRIITELDSELSESWFWLALNHGQLQQYKEACQYLRKYLEQEPDGDYSWQAEEILAYLRSDLPMLSPNQRKKIDRLCLAGIELVNQGRLREAIRCFTRASEIEPEMTGPRNNLALSWFYLGEIGKAIDLSKDILELEPENVFTNCNLAIFYFILEEELAAWRQVQILDELWGDDPDEMLKLGTTYGLLGFDRRAMSVFRVLYDTGYRTFELLLLLGISAFNCGYFSEAANFFSQVNEREPDNPYSLYQQLCRRPASGKIPYHLRVPNETIALLLEGEVGGEELGQLKRSPALWPQLLWIIRHGSAPARKKLIQVIFQINHQPLTEELAFLVWQPELSSECRQEIFSAFVASGIEIWKQCYWNRGLFSKNAASALEQALEILQQRGYGYAAMNRAFAPWHSYCRKKKPRLRNLGLWSAALLVFVEGLDALEENAAQFGVDPRSLYKAVRQLTGLWS
jgi:tetratricopeptide (TPR) repeat protein